MTDTTRRRRPEPEFAMDDYRYWQGTFREEQTIGDTGNSSSARGPIRRIVLIGKTGHGKSASGNTILGCTRREDRKFRPTAGLTSGTQFCEKYEADRFGKRLVVVDTPGLFDTKSSAIETEIGRCVCLSEPGPHVFLLVLSINSRYTPEEKKTIENIEQMFGEMAKRYTIVLFTRIDDLEDDGGTLEQQLHTDTHFSNLVGKFGNKYHGLNNKSNDDEQVRILVDKIEAILENNRGHFYTNEMYNTASMELHKVIEGILRERLPDIRHRQSRLRNPKDIENLWREEVKAAVEEATGIVATILRNKFTVSLGALLGGASLGLIGKFAVAGSAAGPVGAVAGAAAGAAAATALNKLYKK